jgi:hypothetical protein
MGDKNFRSVKTDFWQIKAYLYSQIMRCVLRVPQSGSGGVLAAVRP